MKPGAILTCGNAAYRVVGEDTSGYWRLWRLSSHGEKGVSVHLVDGVYVGVTSGREYRLVGGR